MVFKSGKANAISVIMGILASLATIGGFVLSVLTHHPEAKASATVPAAVKQPRLSTSPPPKDSSEPGLGNVTKAIGRAFTWKHHKQSSNPESVPSSGPNSQH